MKNLTQIIRASDVVLIGPFLIGVGVSFNSLPLIIRIILVFLGVTIIGYNGYNFIVELNVKEVS